MVAGTDSGGEPVTVAPLFLSLIEGAIDPLEQHDEALPGSPWRPRFWLDERISQWLREQTQGANR
ncbi:hypothetical protein KAM353_00250 [Aeromonas caviae]|uniref:Uncharacterized protein n=1 Tax=Aeromonas caviae TaxID=648 RepID=A0AA37CVP8_AERCA|nr:hypothetical protein [Aeromonas caviae]GJA26787.1 hypothetical protein KAM340_09540 [Aeromonas caviae]GJA61991.1 hypothetical protein KAM351_06020 [Aeromonas caviae]GJA70378.1 hypothetical protein KAM353_00250 [Aeromonas caviae]